MLNITEKRTIETTHNTITKAKDDSLFVVLSYIDP